MRNNLQSDRELKSKCFVTINQAKLNTRTTTVKEVNIAKHMIIMCSLDVVIWIQLPE